MEGNAMFLFSVAGLNVRVDNLYPETEEKCAAYRIESDTAYDLTISMTQGQIAAAQKYMKDRFGQMLSLGQAEAEFIHLDLYRQLFAFDAFRMHGVAVEKGGEAYIFTAPSGYGKTTHAGLWVQAFEDARIINGDNPIIRLKDGVFYAYGSPFCGKEGYHVNTGMPLKGICYLQRSIENRIERMEPFMAFGQLMHEYEVFTHKQMEQATKVCNQLVEQVPAYRLFCNKEIDAARVAFEGMR